MNERRKFIKASSLIVAGAGTFGYHAVHASNKMISANTKKRTNMLQHTVYFWVKEDVNEEEKKKFEAGLKDFLSAIKDIHKYEIGIPAATEDRDVVDHSFAYSIFVWFKSIDNHNTYQQHTAHKKFIDDFSGIWKEVKVFDSHLL